MQRYHELGYLTNQYRKIRQHTQPSDWRENKESYGNEYYDIVFVDETEEDEDEADADVTADTEAHGEQR